MYIADKSEVLEKFKELFKDELYDLWMAGVNRQVEKITTEMPELREDDLYYVLTDEADIMVVRNESEDVSFEKPISFFIIRRKANGEALTPISGAAIHTKDGKVTNWESIELIDDTH